MAVNNDNLTLGEMWDQDADMHAQILKQCRDIRFRNPDEFKIAINELYGIALRKLGFKEANPYMAKEELLAGMKRHGIREETDDGEEKDETAAGIYFYKDGDLAMFCSFPIPIIPSPLEINPEPYWIVRTNIS